MEWSALAAYGRRARKCKITAVGDGVGWQAYGRRVWVASEYRTVKCAVTG